jgi:hypothetical protein
MVLALLHKTMINLHLGVDKSKFSSFATDYDWRKILE